MPRKPAHKWLPSMKPQQIEAFMKFQQATVHHDDLRLFVKEGLVLRDGQNDLYLTVRGNAVMEYLNA